MIPPVSITYQPNGIQPQLGITDSAGSLVCIVVGDTIAEARERAQRIVNAVNSAELSFVNYDALAFPLYDQVEAWMNSGRVDEIRQRITENIRLAELEIAASCHTCEEVNRG